MTKRFLLLPKAQKEILEAWKWYEEQQPGLGDRFNTELHKKIQFISKNPLLFPLKGKYREALADNFPYLIVYNIDTIANNVYIISIFHTSRHPKRKSK